MLTFFLTRAEEYARMLILNDKNTYNSLTKIKKDEKCETYLAVIGRIPDGGLVLGLREWHAPSRGR